MDLYQLNMAYAHFRNGTHETPVVFDLFYRANPFGNGYAIAAGLETAIEYLQGFRFTQDDLEYLRSLGLYDEDFLAYLRNLRFTGDVDAVPEGTVVFPNLPLLRVTAPVAQAHLVETALLNIINHQTLIATKAARVVQAAQGDKVLEFGLRRAHGPDAGLYGARASIIAGCEATSNLLAGKLFQIPVVGTHAHAWVQFFESEVEAFRAWARAFPASVLFLVDTYDTLRSGLPNALKVAREVEAAGGKFLGIRLDSGDLAYLSKVARKMLDEAGYPDALIVASSDLDEYLIRDLKAQGARVNVWGVGTNLITARDQPALGGVYKLAAAQVGSQMVPKIKVSDNPTKVTNPGVKKAVRIYEKSTGMAAGDLIMLADEPTPTGPAITLFDPIHPWRRKTVEGFEARELLVPIFRGGELVYTPPPLGAIREYCRQELATFWDEYKRLVNPEIYPVDLSPALWKLKNEMVHAIRGGGP
nr:MAG: nicotinate phosphoribosyltransferase [Bacillota bacterium]